MSGNTTNTLTAAITATDDTTSNVPINFGTGNPAFDSSVCQLVRYLSLPAGQTIIQLPIAVCTQVYIKNNDPAKTILVVWTLNGGAPEQVTQLNPGDQIILWQKPGGTQAGITELALTPSSANALVEYFLGG